MKTYAKKARLRTLLARRSKAGGNVAIAARLESEIASARNGLPVEDWPDADEHREEVKARATALGLEFETRTHTATLLDLIRRSTP